MSINGDEVDVAPLASTKMLLPETVGTSEGSAVAVRTVGAGVLPVHAVAAVVPDEGQKQTRAREEREKWAWGSLAGAWVEV